MLVLHNKVPYHCLPPSVRMCNILMMRVSPPWGQFSTSCSSSGESMPMSRTYRVDQDAMIWDVSITVQTTALLVDPNAWEWSSSRLEMCWCRQTPNCVWQCGNSRWYIHVHVRVRVHVDIMCKTRVSPTNHLTHRHIMHWTQPTHCHRPTYWS